MSTPATDALGLLEVRGEAAGMQALDAAAKSAAVKAVLGRPVCPGKYLLFLLGGIAAVQSAMAAGSVIPGLVRVAALVLPRVHPDVWPALKGVVGIPPTGGLALLETHGAASALEAADAMAKATAIKLLSVRLASGLGGKCLVVCTGTAAALNAAVTVAEQTIGDYLVAERVLPAPHPRVWELVM
jgi:microcompartment protein CcmL/EutN